MAEVQFPESEAAFTILKIIVRDKVRLRGVDLTVEEDQLSQFLERRSVRVAEVEKSCGRDGVAREIDQPQLASLIVPSDDEALTSSEEGRG